MKQKILKVLILAILLDFGQSNFASAFDLEDLIGTEHLHGLLEGRNPVLSQFKDPEPRLLPRHDLLKGLIDKVRRDLEPGTLVETLHLYRKPDVAERAAWTGSEETELYNSMLALSTLTGLKYYSASRGAIRTLYEASMIIDGPATKKPLPDPVYSQPQKELSLFARQHDLSFGDNIYKYDYYYAPGSLIFIQENLTSLSAGIIPAVGKNKLRSVVAILDAGNYILVYVASMAKTVSFPGMKERIGNSFTNRAEAVFNWFSTQADKAFAKANQQ